jgi:photosystem II stability/assembly factor-like uncharacterized protein
MWKTTALVSCVLLLGCEDGTAGVDAALGHDARTPDGGALGRDVGPPRDAGPLVPGVWREITPDGVDPSETPCTDLQFDPSRPETLFAFFGNDSVYKSENSGASWARIGNFPTPLSLGRIRIDPGDASHLYATGSVGGGSMGFWVSHDGGKTWAIPEAFTRGAVAGDWTMDVYNIAVDPVDFDHLLLTSHGGWPCCGDDAGVIESTDGGESFVAHAPPPGMNHGQGVAFLHDPVNGIGDSHTWLVGAGYVDGLFRTSDAGEHWTRVSELHDNHGGFDAHYSAQGYLYLGGEGSVFRSTDNGVTWDALTDGVPYNWYYSVIGDGRFLYTSMAYVGTEPSQVFLVSPEGGPDEGEHWTPYSEQTLPAGPWRMVFDAENRVIYSANWNGGAWALAVD